MRGTLVKLIKFEMRENTAFNLFDMAYLTHPLLIRKHADSIRFQLHLKRHSNISMDSNKNFTL